MKIRKKNRYVFFISSYWSDILFYTSHRWSVWLAQGRILLHLRGSRLSNVSSSPLLCPAPVFSPHWGLRTQSRVWSQMRPMVPLSHRTNQEFLWVWGLIKVPTLVTKLAGTSHKVKKPTRSSFKILSSSGPGPGPRSGPGQVPGQVQKVQGLRTKELDLG